MYYQTTIKSVGAGYAVDVQGKTLMFIGNLPCEAGDTVWTDGRVIFGNTTIQSTPLLDIQQSGIPVVANWVVANDTTCGYFKRSGNFKKKQIAEDNWVTNDGKNYTHGESELNGKKVIDADISDGGDVFVATDGFYRKCQKVTYNNHLFNISSWRASEKDYYSGETTFISDHSFIVRTIPVVGQKVTLGAEAEDIDTPVRIYKNGDVLLEIPLEEYAQIAVEECWQCESELQEQSADISGAVNFIQQPPPTSDSFIALSYARVETFRIDADGNWDAIISAAAYGHCFLYILLDGSLFHILFENAELRKFSKSLALGLDMLEYAMFTENFYPFLDVEQYPAFTGTKTDGSGNYTAAYQQYTEEKLEYYIPLVRFVHYKWEPFIFSSNFLFHVHNGEIVTTIISASGGGNVFEVTESWDEENPYGSYGAPSNYISTPDRLYTDGNGNYTVIEKNQWTFPLGDDYFLNGEGYDMLTIDKDGELFYDFSGSDILADEVFEPVYPMPLLTLYDEVAVSSSYDLDFFNHIYIPAFTYQNSENLINYYMQDTADKEIYYPLWIHLSQDSDDGFFRFSFSAATLKSGTALLGVYDGKLYKTETDAGWQQAGSGLKNFRLREMKNINKARK